MGSHGIEAIEAWRLAESEAKKEFLRRLSHPNADGKILVRNWIPREEIQYLSDAHDRATERKGECEHGNAACAGPWPHDTAAWDVPLPAEDRELGRLGPATQQAMRERLDTHGLAVLRGGSIFGDTYAGAGGRVAPPQRTSGSVSSSSAAADAPALPSSPTR